jgi:hypothetical protein
VQWKEAFEPVPILAEPCFLRFKVYNKKYSSYRDDLIGEVEVELSTHGLMKVPLYTQNEHTSVFLTFDIEVEDNFAE